MFASVSLSGFRGLDLDLEGLGRVNLVLGRSGSGKTALLEGLLCSTVRANAEIVQTLASLRGFPTNLAGADLVAVFDDFATRGREGRASFASRYQGRSIDSSLRRLPSQVVPGVSAGTRVVSVASYEMHTREVLADGTATEHSNVGHVLPEGHFFVEPQDPFETPSWYRTSRRLSNQLELTRNWSALTPALQARIIEILRELQPGVTHLAVVVRASPFAQLSVEHEELGACAPSLFGDAFSELLEYLLLVAKTRGGTLLLDEIGAAFDPQVVDVVIPKLIGFLGENNVQLFASTHSLDIVDAVLGAAKSDDARVIRLRRSKEGLANAKVFTGAEAATLRGEFGLDLRRVA